MWFYLALLSAFFNAIANIARRTHGSLASPAELSWWTLLFGLPLGIGLILVSNRPMYTSHAFLIPTIIAGVINTLASVLQFRAYRLSDASIVSPIANFLPILLVVTSFVMLGVAPNVGGLVGILFVVAGVYYSSVNGRHDLFHPIQQMFKNPGSRAMLGTVALWSITNNLEKISLRTASPAFLTVMQAGIMFSILSVYLLARPQRRRLKRGERVIKKWGWHIVAIAVFAVLAAFFQMQAVALANPSYVLSVKRLDVLFTVVFAGVFLHEKHILKRFKGAIIAVIGVVIICLFR